MYSANLKKGYTLIETVIYVAILSIIYFLVVSTLLSFSSSYRNVVALRIVDNSGTNSMERMTREVRGAGAVDIINSTLGSSPGALTIISTSNGISTTTKFYLQNGIIKMDINGAYYGPLTLNNASVTNLVFYKLDNTNSTAVKIDMTVTGTSGFITKTKSYHSTIVLKGN
jgi:type II secretory pathway pseudopilin PulG